MTEIKPSTQYRTPQAQPAPTCLDSKGLHKLCVKHYRDGNQIHWKAMFIAYSIDRKYGSGSIASLAAELALEDSTVYGWMDGVECLRALSVRGDDHRLKFPDVRRLIHGDDKTHSLRPSYFITVGELWRKLEFSDVEAYNYLKTCAENGVKVRALRAQIIKEHGNPPAEWGKQLAAVESRLANLSVDTDVPEAARALMTDLGSIAKRATVDEPAHIKALWAILTHVKRILHDQEAEGDDLAWATAQLDWLERRLDARGQK